MNRYILLGIVALSVLGIAPYVSFISPSLSLSSQGKAQSKDFFDEVAEVGEKLRNVDEDAENVRNAGEEFIRDVSEGEGRRGERYSSERNRSERKERARQREERGG